MACVEPWQLHLDFAKAAEALEGVQMPQTFVKILKKNDMPQTPW